MVENLEIYTTGKFQLIIVGGVKKINSLNNFLNRSVLHG